MEQGKIIEFAQMIKNCRKAVFFGGAGVSTESGVKDYRSEDGLYNTVREYGVSPETILSRSFFERAPEIFYDFYSKYFLVEEVEPNPAHFTLAELEKMGKLDAVITQNIDGLHQKAGSKRVLELHGTTFTYRCHRCGSAYPSEKVAQLQGAVPKCDKCGGNVRPDIVLYEEPLDNDVITESIKAISSADLLIIGGTSLAVQPAAFFLRYFSGNDIVLINRDSTAYDYKASIIFRDKIGEVLSATIKLLAD